MFSSFNNKSYDGSGEQWNDMTTNNHNFVWSNKPKWSNIAGFNTYNNSLICGKLIDMNISDKNPEFTLVWFGQNKINTQGLFTVIPTVDGNISINIDAISNSLLIKHNNNILGTYNIGLASMDLMYSIVYNDNHIILRSNNLKKMIG